MGKHKSVVGTTVSCKACAAGRVAGLQQDACTLCDSGEGYIPDVAHAACVVATALNFLCVPGKRVVDATHCAKCEAGRFTISTTLLECTKCPFGRFASMPGATTCDACAPNFVSTMEPGAKVCTACDDGFIPDSVAATCTPCAVGSYRSKPTENASSVCIQCPKRGVDCKGGTLALEQGVWYPFEHSARIGADTEIHECFNSESCTVDANTGALRCTEELGYYGPLCGACDRKKDFIRSGAGCTQCWHTVLNVGATAAICVGWILLIGYYTIVQDFDAPLGYYANTTLKMLISHVQMLGVLGIFKAKGTAVFTKVMSQPSQVVGGSITSVLPLKCAMNSQAYGSFLANMTLPLLVPLIAVIFLAPMVLISRRIALRRLAKPVPAFKGVCNLPRRWVPCYCLRTPMTANDIDRYHSPVDFSSRLIAIIIFMLFTLYPTLVRSVSSMLSCTDPIMGRRHLIADLSVQCFFGWHLVYVGGATLGFFVYCLGVPLTVYQVTAWKTPLACRERHFDKVTGRMSSTKCHPRCRCTRRRPKDYISRSVRLRFGFLFHGYETDRIADRSGIVVSWEALVMVRKLFVTLASASITDPYLQILAALLILLSAVTMQATFQPYEPDLLDTLDTFSIFSLIVTQILSIVYLYVDTQAVPAIPKNLLEVLVTFGLFALNIVTIVAIFLVWLKYFLGIHSLRACCRVRKQAMMIQLMDPTVIEHALAMNAEDSVMTDSDEEDLRWKVAKHTRSRWWRHPSGRAHAMPPRRCDAADAEVWGADVWLWKMVGVDSETITASSEMPQLFERAPEKYIPAPEEYTCMFYPGSMTMTESIEVPPDIGGTPFCGCCCQAPKPTKRPNEIGIATHRLTVDDVGTSPRNARLGFANDDDESNDALEIGSGEIFASSPLGSPSEASFRCRQKKRSGSIAEARLKARARASVRISGMRLKGRLFDGEESGNGMADGDDETRIKAAERRQKLAAELASKPSEARSAKTIEAMLLRKEQRSAQRARRRQRGECKTRDADADGAQVDGGVAHVSHRQARMNRRKAAAAAAPEKAEARGDAPPGSKRFVDWWMRRGLVVGDRVCHPRRGEGEIVQINVDYDDRVYVRFDSPAETHRYYEKSWGKFAVLDEDAAAAASRERRAKRSKRFAIRAKKTHDRAERRREAEEDEAAALAFVATANPLHAGATRTLNVYVENEPIRVQDVANPMCAAPSTSTHRSL